MLVSDLNFISSVVDGKGHKTKVSLTTTLLVYKQGSLLRNKQMGPVNYGFDPVSTVLLLSRPIEHCRLSPLRLTVDLQINVGLYSSSIPSPKRL